MKVNYQRNMKIIIYLYGSFKIRCNTLVTNVNFYKEIIKSYSLNYLMF